MYAIGIESCVNYGRILGDLYQTWQRTAKFIANLLDKYDLPLEAVVSHAEISRIGMNMGLASYLKCCPITLRHAGLWVMANEMIKYEHLYLQKIVKEGYKAEIIINPDSREYIDTKGRVIKLPSVPTTVSYTIKLTTPDNITAEKQYSSILPSQSVNYITRCDMGDSCSVNNITNIPSIMNTRSLRLR
jgi:hypothetical protein